MLARLVGRAGRRRDDLPRDTGRCPTVQQDGRRGLGHRRRCEGVEHVVREWRTAGRREQQLGQHRDQRRHRDDAQGAEHLPHSLEIAGLKPLGELLNELGLGRTAYELSQQKDLGLLVALGEIDRAIREAHLPTVESRQRPEAHVAIGLKGLLQVLKDQVGVAFGIQLDQRAEHPGPD